MRRILTVTLLGVIFVGFLPTHTLAQQQNVAIVYKLLLDKQLLVQPTSGEAKTGQVGDLLHHGDYLQTDDNTRAAIRFTDDGSVMRMNPQCELQIRAEGERSALRKILKVDMGELWARVRRREGAEYRIETPSAVAAVKGTEFIVKVEPGGKTTVIAIEGVLDFFNDVGSVEIPAGSTGVAVSASEGPVVEPTRQGDIAAFSELVGEEFGVEQQEDLVEVTIFFVDEDGNRKTVIIKLPRSQAQQYIPPSDN